jgi:hypothetical protein
MKTLLDILKMWPLLLAIFIIGFVGYSCAQPQPASNVVPPKIDHYTFKVTSGFLATRQPEIIKVSANEGDTIRVMFSVAGFLGRDIDFSMKNPAGDIIFDELRVPKEFTQDFVASTSGTYQLIFEDNFSPISRTITLTTLIYPK